MTTTTEIDVVTASVSAYSDHVGEYTDYNANQVFDVVHRFAQLLPDGALVLDAGCGPGRDIARFAALGHHPVGVDLNLDFVAAARRHGPVRVADLRDLPFPDNTFAGVWACASLVHLPTADAERALAELARVARPKAPVCVSVKHAGTTGWADTAHGRRWFRIWEPAEFAAAVTAAGMRVDGIEVGPVFVDVWAHA